MKWLKWSIASGEMYDPLPILIGCVLLLVSLPAFVLVMFYPDHDAGSLGQVLLVCLGIGTVLGTSFLIYGIRNTAYPGSLAYRITHGRIFFR